MPKGIITAWYCEKCDRIYSAEESEYSAFACVRCYTDLKKIKLIRVDEVRSYERPEQAE